MRVEKRIFRICVFFLWRMLGSQYMIFLAGYRMQNAERIPTDLLGYHWVKTNKSAACASAEAYLQNRCWHCGVKLVPVTFPPLPVAFFYSAVMKSFAGK